MKHQLFLYGHIARLPADDILRRSILVPGDVRPAHYSFKKRGAPKHQWHDRVFQKALGIAGTLQELRTVILSELEWRHRVDEYLKVEQARCAFGAY